nr:MAG TPA: hypothetical protein [Caudoviricetes sp.]
MLRKEAHQGNVQPLVHYYINTPSIECQAFSLN